MPKTNNELYPGNVYEVRIPAGSTGWLGFLRAVSDTFWMNDDVLLVRPKQDIWITETDGEPAPEVEIQESRELAPGYYWLDAPSEAYLEYYPWIRWVGLHPKRTQEQNGMAWVLLHAPKKVLWPRKLAMQVGDVSVAPNGINTTLADVLQSPDVESPWQTWDRATDAVKSASSLVMWGALTIGGLGILSLLGKGKK